MCFVLGVRGTLSLETNASLPVDERAKVTRTLGYHRCSCLGQPVGLERSAAIEWMEEIQPSVKHTPSLYGSMKPDLSPWRG